MDLGLKNKTAVVQGASTGLGYGVAQALSREGARVVIGARNRSPLEEAAAALTKETGSPVLPVACDVTRSDNLVHLFQTCRKEFGDPHILVCNAGGPPTGKFTDLSADDWQSALNTNFLSAVASVAEVVDAMKAYSWGRILFITSISVKQPIDDLILSNSARSALTAYAKTISRDLAPHGITVNCLLPGAHRTRRLDELVRRQAKTTGKTEKEIWKQYGAGSPMGRLGTPEELGNVAAFYCSEKASYITGQSIVHDGGTIKGLF